MADEFNDERVGELGRRRLRPLPVDLYIFPEDWNHDRILRHGLTEILQNEKKIIEQNKEIMADLSKLKTSVTAPLRRLMQCCHPPRQQPNPISCHS